MHELSMLINYWKSLNLDRELLAYQKPTLGLCFTKYLEFQTQIELLNIEPNNYKTF